MSRRARCAHGQHCVWSGITEEMETTPLVMTYDPEELKVQGSEWSESDSEEYQAVRLSIPAVMPMVLPVTGESFCQCPPQTEVTLDPELHAHANNCLCGEEEQGCDWVWDEGSTSSAAFLSCSNRKVSFHTEYSCGTAAIRGTRELGDGQHFWEIKMTSPVYGTDMMVGIGTSEVNLDQSTHSFCSLLGTDEDSWGLSYMGLLQHKGTKVSFSPRFGQGSIIGMHLDTWHGTLTYYKNRRCIGVAATRLQNKRFYPMVCSTAAKSSMKLIRSCSAPTSLQYLCCARLRHLLPACADALSALPLPPGLRPLLRSQLGWVLGSAAADAGEAERAEDPADGPSPTFPYPDPAADCPSSLPHSCPCCDAPLSHAGPCPPYPSPCASPSSVCPNPDSPSSPLPCSCPYPLPCSCPAPLCGSDSSSSEPETCQRKRCRWT